MPWGKKSAVELRQTRSSRQPLHTSSSTGLCSWGGYFSPRRSLIHRLMTEIPTPEEDLSFCPSAELHGRLTGSQLCQFVSCSYNSSSEGFSGAEAILGTRGFPVCRWDAKQGLSYVDHHALSTVGDGSAVTARAVCLIWAAADGSFKTERDWHYQQSKGITCSFCSTNLTSDSWLFYSSRWHPLVSVTVTAHFKGQDIVLSPWYLGIHTGEGFALKNLQCTWWFPYGLISRLLFSFWPKHRDYEII